MKVMVYRVIKPSAFLFATPHQRAKIVRRWERFEQEHGAGLELLALRRSYGERKEGSITDIAEAIYRLIRAGKTNLDKDFNLGRLPEPVLQKAWMRKGEVQQRKRDVEEGLFDTIDVSKLDLSVMPTAHLIRAGDFPPRAAPGLISEEDG
jgi:hypothetical protein